MAVIREGLGALNYGDPCTHASGQPGKLEPWYDENGELLPYPICSTTGPVYKRPAGTTVTTTVGPTLGPYSATPRPNALARAAKTILDSLAPGSGHNPIGVSVPYPHDPAGETVADGGGYRSMPWYWVHPVRDASGLIDWTGPDSAQPVAGLSQAQSLAMQVLLAGGDTSWSADFNSHYPDAPDPGGSYAPFVPPTYTPIVPPLPPGATPAGAPRSGSPATTPTTTPAPEPPLDDPFRPTTDTTPTGGGGPPIETTSGGGDGVTGGAGGAGGGSGLLVAGGLAALALVAFSAKRKR